MDKQSSYLSHQEIQNGFAHDDTNQNNLDHQSHTLHSHNHNFRAEHSRILFWCLIITFSFAIIEAIGGYFTHSITLQSDAVHMLTDAAGLLIAYIANNISKKPATSFLTFGYGHAETIGALINCIFTLILTAGLLVEVAERFLNPVAIHGYSLFIIASIGFIINGAVAFILSKFSESLNTRAAFIHAMGDLLGSAIAIIAGIIIYFTNFSLIDTILSLIVIIILITSNFKIIKKAMRILMAGVPEHLNYEMVGQDLEEIDGIIGVHDLHIWHMSANKAALSAHIVVNDPSIWQESLSQCQKMLATKHGIEHVTLQYEFKPDCLNMKYCESQ
ncbi:MAG: cation diffusion facilitator family transporter [Proteobacteria bacterium]|jgi:cobalt-zinc-cadmium efflux system protein|nr:cation diffusion facilitator family transporter [Pseudomonadota bacterium]